MDRGGVTASAIAYPVPYPRNVYTATGKKERTWGGLGACYLLFREPTTAGSTPLQIPLGETVPSVDLGKGALGQTGVSLV
ncbi:hypothetical protein TMatcc_003874 [Talaromyces marneffei ATCC 18224]